MYDPNHVLTIKKVSNHVKLTLIDYPFFRAFVVESILQKVLLISYYGSSLVCICRRVSFQFWYIG